MGRVEDDASLIERVLGGSEEALAELYERFWPAVWQWAYAVTSDRMLADHAAQEAMIRALYSLDRFDVQRPFGPWLKRITVNQAIDELRRDRRVSAPFRSVVDLGGTTDEQEQSGELMEAVLRLPVQRRLVVVLHYWLDYGTDEIAHLLGIAPGTVSSRLHRARNELRNLLSEHHA
jgi:RNA polymerase sigma-70 factor (ECF subfamily)